MHAEEKKERKKKRRGEEEEVWWLYSNSNNRELLSDAELYQDHLQDNQIDINPVVVT